MRICMFSNLYPPVPSGSSQFASLLSKTLAARGHTITVVAAQVPGTAERELDEGVEVIRLPCLMLPPIEIAHGFRYLSITVRPSNMRRLAHLCEERRFDMLHQHGQIFDLALSSAWLARRYGLPLVNTIHTPVHHTNRLYKRVLDSLDRTLVKRLVIGHAGVLVAPDRTVLEYCAERYGHPFVEEVPYGVTPLPTSPERGAEVRRQHGLGDRPVILSLGHVHNLRDRTDLVAALPQVIRRVPDVHLLVVGDLLTHRPVELVRRLDLNQHVTFVGGVPHEKVGDYLSAATVEAHWLGATPGLGVAAMEAMAVGVPVVTSIQEDGLGQGLLRPWENVVIVRQGDVAGIAQALVRLLTDGALRDRVGAAGRRLIEERFSWRSVGDRMEGLYQRLLDSRAAA